MTVNRILPDLNFSTDFKVRDQALEILRRRIKEAAVSTRQALIPFAVAADPHQEAVIKSPARTIGMVAPAGAGKTQTIIYGFRGCTPDYIIDLEQHLARPIESHELQINYRCPPLIVAHDGLIPHQRAEVEEERRLFYVAMTRASSNLVLSYVQSVCSCKVQPSRFLYEAGLLERAVQSAKRPCRQCKP